MINIIPNPREYEVHDGFYRLDENCTITSELDLPLVSSRLAENGDIRIIMDKALPEEHYTLDVNADGVTIKASSDSGAYYALQSLRQLCHAGDVPYCSVKDSPRYKWRGMQLDISRHFFDKNEIKRLLDMMHMMKLNVFHWHLTDDPGWRIEIKKYPLLTEIGSIREYSHVNGWQSRKIINERHSGYYTQDDIREIVAYAGERGIMVVPEIDFPAHCASAIAAYPWLACRELDRPVPGYFGGTIPERVYKIKDWNRPVCLGKDKVIDFIKDIIDEVCELFPAPYFHIGGDETDTKEWSVCPECQKRIKENHLSNTDDLQGWFNNQLLEYLKSKGKSLIGWNDILRAGNIDNSIVVQYWTPKRDKKAEEYAAKGGKMIMSNHQAFYFDMTYSQYPLKNTYCYKSQDFGITPSENVLGLEGELWTEWIDGREKLDLNTYPRMQALAEAAWSTEGKDWQDFLKRLDTFKPFYEELGIGYAVDKVANPKNPLSRLINQKKFVFSDTHSEVKLNKKYKSKGEK